MNVELNFLFVRIILINIRISLFLKILIYFSKQCRLQFFSRRSCRLEKLYITTHYSELYYKQRYLKYVLIVLVDYDYMYLFYCFHNIKIHILFIEKITIYKYFVLFFLHAYEYINSRM